MIQKYSMSNQIRGNIGQQSIEVLNIYVKNYDNPKHYNGKVLSYDDQLLRKEGKQQKILRRN